MKKTILIIALLVSVFCQSQIYRSGGGSSSVGSGVTAGTKGDINVVGADTDWQIVANAVGTSEINDAAVTIPKISATGTADGTTYLRGDGTWATPAGGGSGVTSPIAVRTGTTISAMMIQTESQLDTDGEPAVDEVVFCSDCAPADTVTAGTLEVNAYNAYDDRATDAATFTFSDLKIGATVMIEINRSTDAIYSGVTVAYDEGSFSADTRQLVTLFVLPSGDVWRKYKTIQ